MLRGTVLIEQSGKYIAGRNDEAISMNFLTNEVWIRWATTKERADKGINICMELQLLATSMVQSVKRCLYG